MTKHLERLAVNLAGRVSRRKLNGRSYLVAPVVLGVEGVLNGNAGATGPGFYAGTEWAKAVPSWNHKPITNGHPKDANGNYVSAAAEGFLETHTMGFLLNAKYDTKLRANAWFDEEKTLEVEPRVHQALMANKIAEVSTGVFVDEVKEKGDHNGKPFEWKAVNHQPDHLAVLMDEVGACSVADGAGLLQVNSGGTAAEASPSLHRALVQSAARVGAALVANELSYSDVSCRLNDALSSRFGEPGKSWPGYITDVYPDRVIFRKDYGYRDDGLFMMTYTVTDKDEVSLTGDAVEVARKTTYTTAAGKVVGNVGTDGSFSPHEETVMAFDKAAHLGKLIGNGGYAESDREWLTALPDGALEKVKPIAANANPVPAPVPTPVPTPAPTPTPAPAGPMTFDQLRANADAGTREMLDTLYASHQARFAGFVQTITSVPGNALTAAELNAMPVTLVEKLAANATAVLAAVQPAGVPVAGFPQTMPHQSFLGAQGGFAANAVAPPSVKAPQPPKLTFDDAK